MTPNGRWTTYEPNPEFVSQINSRINSDDKVLNHSIEASDSQINSQINSQIRTRIENDANLSDDQKKILIAMCLNPTIATNALADKIDMKVSAVRYQREKMKGYVNTKRVGSNKVGRWEILFVKDGTNKTSPT